MSETPDWDGTFTPEQEAFHCYVEENTERFLALLDRLSAENESPSD